MGYCDKLTEISPLRSLKLRILNLHGTGVTDEGIAQFLNDGAGSLLEEIDLSATKAERSNSITDATAQLIGVSSDVDRCEHYTSELHSHASAPTLTFCRHTVQI